MSDLIVIPTESESHVIRCALESMLSKERFSELKIAEVGFGPIASAARTTKLISDLRPTRVLLVGIAGTYDNRLPIGTATSFNQVVSHGVGAGTADKFISALEMGWSQLDGITGMDGIPHESEQGSSDILRLSKDDVLPRKGTLVTCCAASADTHDANDRMMRFPTATAEDMEAFAVGLACRLFEVEFEVVRGISNHAGDRDTSNWSIKPALESAAELLPTVLQ